jgi:multidrug efflux pump subunit AcrA (membrane-fusion protein)
MRIRGFLAIAAGALCTIAAAAWAQGTKTQAPAQTSARVETALVQLVQPERYQVPLVLEPARRIAVMAMADGIVRAINVPLGASVRENQDVVQLDRGQASAHLKIAQAELKEAQASATGKTGNEAAIAQAKVDAAQARAELCQLELDHCTLRASFAGRVLNLPVSAGQYVAKGTTLADLADVSSLRVLVPVDRNAVKEGGTLDLFVEGKSVSAKVQAVLPLPEQHSVLRELATPWAAAWVSIANADGKSHEPGQRVHDPFLPTTPIAIVPSRALREADEKGGGSVIQVVRSEYVTPVPIRVMGVVGPERTQVSGPFRANDLVIVESSVPLAAGALIRFGARPDAPVEGVAPEPGLPGVVADVTQPAGGVPTGTSGSRIAPIGAPDSNVPRSASRGGTQKAASKPATKPATKPANQPPNTNTGGGVPF